MKTLNLVLNIIAGGIFLIGTVGLLSLLGVPSSSTIVGYMFLIGLAGLLIGIISMIVMSGQSKNSVRATNTLFTTGLLLSSTGLLLFLFQKFGYENIQITEIDLNRMCVIFSLIGIPMVWFAAKSEYQRVENMKLRRSRRIERLNQESI